MMKIRKQFFAHPNEIFMSSQFSEPDEDILILVTVYENGIVETSKGEVSWATQKACIEIAETEPNRI